MQPYRLVSVKPLTTPSFRCTSAFGALKKMWLSGLTRVLLFALIVGIAVDYFFFDMQYMTSAGVYLQRMGRSINADVTRLLERGR
jgi:hypothetical protein